MQSLADILERDCVAPRLPPAPCVGVGPMSPLLSYTGRG